MQYQKILSTQIASKHLILFSLIIFLFLHVACAQQQSTSISFSEIWVWEYEDTKGNKREMAIYREPKLNYWLLTPDDANFRDKDEMTLWFILKPNGEVIQAFQDAEMNNLAVIKHQLSLKKITKLPKSWKPSGNVKSFGNTEYGFSTFSGKEYKIKYEKSDEKTSLFIGRSNADFSILALFNELNIEAKLPIQFPKNIPKNNITLLEHTVSSNFSLKYQYKYTTPTNYDIKYE